MVRLDLSVREQYVKTRDGWSLHLRRTVSPLHFKRDSKPLLIVPGYGMNTFIFSFHPRGTSIERCLAEGGFEVWSVNLRGQGHSKRHASNAPGPTMLRYATIDVPTAVEHVLSRTQTTASALSMVGCSLGGTIAYSHLAMCPNHAVAELITMGGPLRWTDIHPLVRVAFSSPRLAGSLRLSGTRTALRNVMPLLRRAPSLLSMYMNTASIDMTAMNEMANTVEDPDPNVNRDIARWLRRRDLVLNGINVTEAMRDVAVPLLIVLSNRDGIVPESTALSAESVWGGRDVEVLKVGSDTNWYAHANLFIADDAPTLVFEPMIRWLRRFKATASMPPPVASVS